MIHLDYEWWYRTFLEYKEMANKIEYIEVRCNKSQRLIALAKSVFNEGVTCLNHFNVIKLSKIWKNERNG